MILLKTKINIPPMSTKLLSRQHLLEKLDAGIDKKLTLISAPAGFGKSSLIYHWFNERRPQIAWYSIDEDDNDASVFFHYLLSALQMADESLSKAFHPMLQDINMPAERDLMSAVIDQLCDCSDKIFLVFDDFHLIHSKTIIDTIAYLLLNAPPQLHMTIVTRQDPALPLARLRAKNEITEIKAADLKFREDEVSLFFNDVMKIRLSDRSINLLTEQTEGWVVGLQMAGVAMQQGPDSTEESDRITARSKFIFDYLLEEVVSQQPAEIQAFLLKTSILRTFNADLCDCLTQTGNSIQLLDQLDGSGLFLIPLDNNRQWFRYHHLFREFLLHRLKYFGQESTDVLHKKASGWYEKEAFIEEAFHHAIATQDYEFSADLLERHLFTLLVNYKLMTVRRMINKIPLSIRKERYLLRLYRGFSFFLQEEFEDVNLILGSLQDSSELLNNHDAEKRKYTLNMYRTLMICNSFYKDMSDQTIAGALEALEEIPQENELAKAMLEDAAVRALIESGDLAGASSRVETALRLFNRGQTSFVFGYFLCLKVEIELIQGHLQRAEKTLATSLDEIQQDKYQHHPVFMFLYNLKAEIHFKKNQMDQSLDAVLKAKRYAEAMSEKGGMIKAYRTESLIHQVLGNEKKVRDLMEEAAMLAHSSRSIFREAHTDLHRVRLALMQMDREGAANSIDAWDLNEHQPFTRLYLLRCILLGRFYLINKEYEKAGDLMATLRKRLGKNRFHDAAMEMDIITAAALFSSGRHKAGVSMLANAVEFAESEGYVWPFVDYEAYITDMLSRLLNSKKKAVRQHSAVLLKALRNKFEMQILTPREADIMQLIASGLTNQEIADQIYVSMSTVKSHINHIFSKLCVNTRNDAIIKAKELHIA